jgi:putative ABC transport system permease protein
MRSSSHGQWLRKGLVVFQFSATAILLISMVTVYLQINHLRSYDLGMEVEQTLVVRAPKIGSTFLSGFQTFKSELLQRPEIQSVTRSEAVPGLSLNDLNTSDNVKRIGFENSHDSYNYYFYNIDADFIPTLKMNLLAGRNFEEGNPNEDQVIINEEAVYRLGFANVAEAIGSKITFKTRWPGEPSTIIGVLKNYYQRSPKESHIPMIFYYDEDASYLSMRFNSQNIEGTLADVKAVWNNAFPNSVFQYFFLDQKYNQQYQADARFGEVIALFSGLAIFIACLGLLGLSSYIIVQRTKEIGIRKVLGASGSQIVRLLSQDFIKVIVIASIIAVPIAWYTMESWLSNYTVRITQSVYVFAFPVITILIVALVIVSLQTFKVAQTNPVDTLKE